MDEVQAQSLASMPQVTGQKKLLEFMKLELDFGYDERLRSSIYADLLYDTFSHAVVKGFCWRDVCRAVNLTQRLLEELIGKNLVEAASIYQQTALSSGIDNRSLTIYTDYFFSTFMRHYKLYQLVFQSRRQLTSYTDCVVVEPPIPPHELQYGKLPTLHEYDQKLKEIQGSKPEVQEIQPFEGADVSLDDGVKNCTQAEALEKIISQVMESVARPLVDNITETITSTYDDLNVKLDETALPRPKQLGPPPRYQLKQALSVSKTTAAAAKPPAQKNSAKGDRKKSGKAK